MNLGIRSKLLLVWLGPILLAMVVAVVYLGGALDRLLVDRIRADLIVRLELCEREASAEAAAEPAPRWNALAHDLGRRAHARVTLVGPGGAVLGDSDLDDDAVARVENHADRPEVQQALAAGPAALTRHSATLGYRMMYAAAHFWREREVAGVVRLAVPLREVDETVGALRRLLVLGGLLGLAAAALLAVIASHLVSRSLRHLTAAAGRMAAGDLEVRTHPTGTDEVAALGTALDRLADNLSRSLGEVRDERDLLDRILSGMQEGILLLDGAGAVELVNPALREMLLLGADAVGRPLLEVIRHAALKELLERSRLAEETVTGEIEVGGLRPRRLLVHARKLAGEPAGLLVVFVDVTELRRLETIRRDFVANVSHELRTPISAVRSAAETMRGAAASDPAASAHFLEMIERNAERLQRLVEDLLDLSRIESREFKVALETVPVLPAVERVLQVFRDRAVARWVTLAAEVPADLPPARADRRALEQVLANLVDNATKYCIEGAKVTVRVSRDGAMIRVVVTDTGPGIEERHLPRLFERFYRVDAGRSRELGGTGLGLSIVKHLVEAMGGAVAVESTVGVGSSFTVTLPRA
ncbi:MAG: HAMP domain-containing protein [Deltaproteobacteria bacterium]|nr:HAMP domain-containing protein [Deltaproteobacteria bacterium]